MRPYLFVIIAVAAREALADDPYKPTTVEYTPYRGTTPTPGYVPTTVEDEGAITIEYPPYGHTTPTPGYVLTTVGNKRDKYCTHDLKNRCPKDCTEYNCPMVCTMEYRPVIGKCKYGHNWKEEEFSNCCQLQVAVCKKRVCKFVREKEIPLPENQY